MRTPDLLSIEFIIIGGSLTGLSSAIALARAGHKVTLFDSSDAYKGTPIDGGCRMPPNASKVYYRWGLEKRLRECSLKATGTVFAQYDSGSVLGAHEWEEEVMEETGGDFLLLHYTDLRRILADCAREHGATLRFNEGVTHVQPDRERPSVTLASGERLEADVVVGCDGRVLPGYITRTMMLKTLGQADERTPTGMQVFHLLIPDEEMNRLDILKGIRESGKVFTWIGPTYGALGYPIAPLNGPPCFTVYLYAPHTESEHSGEQESKGVFRTDREVVLNVINKETAEPRLMKLAESAAHVACIPVIHQPPLEEWVHPDGRVLCIGESAHPIPISSTYAVGTPAGDGGVLGRLFSHLHHRAQIDRFLSAVQEIREGRVADILAAAEGNIFAVAAHDRRLRERLDMGLKSLQMTSGHTSEHMIQVVEQMFAYDPEDAAEDWWVEWGVMHERAARWSRGGDEDEDEGGGVVAPEVAVVVRQEAEVVSGSASSAEE
ncbi:FAD/NAD-P-binding domain-containing protein [Daedaleopsis nitida]|nr:FAD/NAD-P-binding domain-containing protein [Daedaleopsis nitida]